MYRSYYASQRFVVFVVGDNVFIRNNETHQVISLNRQFSDIQNVLIVDERIFFVIEHSVFVLTQASDEAQSFINHEDTIIFSKASETHLLTISQNGVAKQTEFSSGLVVKSAKIMDSYTWIRCVDCMVDDFIFAIADSSPLRRPLDNLITIVKPNLNITLRSNLKFIHYLTFVSDSKVFVMSGVSIGYKKVSTLHVLDVDDMTLQEIYRVKSEILDVATYKDTVAILTQDEIVRFNAFDQEHVNRMSIELNAQPVTFALCDGYVALADKHTLHIYHVAQDKWQETVEFSYSLLAMSSDYDADTFYALTDTGDVETVTPSSL